MAQYSLEKMTTAFYTDYIIVDSAGMKLALPYEVQRALNSPQMISFIGGKYLYFNDADTVFEYDVINRTKREILRVSGDPEYLFGPAWSTDSSQFLTLAVNLNNNDNALYENSLYLIRTDGSLPPKKLQCSVNFWPDETCHSTPGEDFYFIDNETIAYKTNVKCSENPGKIIVVKTSLFQY